VLDELEIEQTTNTASLYELVWWREARAESRSVLADGDPAVARGDVGDGIGYVFG
jgi:hypothetical protein